MKKFLRFALLCAVVLTTAVSCSEDDSEAAVASVKSLTIKPETLNITVGETKQLTYSVEPAEYKGTPVWASSNSAKATVSADGKIKALEDGKVSISVTIGGMAKTCMVTIAKAKVNVTGVSIKGDAIIELKETKQVILESIVAPLDATNQIAVWTSSDAKIATASLFDGKCIVIGIAEGTATITATIDGKTANVTVNVISNSDAVKTPKEMVGYWKGLKFNLIEIATETVISEDGIKALLMKESEEGKGDGMSQDEADEWVSSRRTKYWYQAKETSVDWHLELQTSKKDVVPVTKEWFTAPGELLVDEDDETLYAGIFDTSAFFTAKTEEKEIRLAGKQITITGDWNKTYKSLITYDVVEEAPVIPATYSVKSIVKAPRSLRRQQ